MNESKIGPAGLEGGGERDGHQGCDGTAHFGRERAKNNGSTLATLQPDLKHVEA